MILKRDPRTRNTPKKATADSRHKRQTCTAEKTEINSTANTTNLVRGSSVERNPEEILSLDNKLSRSIAATKDKRGPTGPLFELHKNQRLQILCGQQLSKSAQHWSPHLYADYPQPPKDSNRYLWTRLPEYGQRRSDPVRLRRWLSDK